VQFAGRFSFGCQLHGSSEGLIATQSSISNLQFLGLNFHFPLQARLFEI
jgi:hypothetical protein